MADFCDPRWPLVVAANVPLSKIVGLITPGDWPTFAVVERGSLVGVISMADVGRIISTSPSPGSDSGVIIAYDLMHEPANLLLPDQSLYQALESLRDTGCDALPVVMGPDRKEWLGMLTRQHVYNLLKQQIAASKEQVLKEHQGLIALDQQVRLEHLQLAVLPMEEARVQRLMVPQEIEGRSIRQSRFQTVYGKQVIAIEDASGSIECPPDLDRSLTGDMRLLAISLAAEPALRAA